MRDISPPWKIVIVAKIRIFIDKISNEFGFKKRNL